MKLKIGEIVEFGYDEGIGHYPQKRSCHIEEIGKSGQSIVWIYGWDTTTHKNCEFQRDKMFELVD